MDYFENLFGLADKTALVTGGGGGVGRLISEALMRAGARVLITSRKPEQCDLIAAELNGIDAAGSAQVITADVATEAGISSLVDEVACSADQLDILVNNAGRTWGAPLGSFPYAKWQDVFAVNVTAMFSLTQSLLPLLRAAAAPSSPARIINLGSTAALQPMGDGAYSYSASKAAVHQLTQILAKELAVDNIAVNALALGPFYSRMTGFALKDNDARASVAERIPLGRIGEAHDIAAATLLLCGPGGGFISGAILPVDGGLSVVGGCDLYGGIT